MLLLYELDPVFRVVTVTMGGKLTNEDLIAIYDILKNDRLVQPDFALIIDLGQTTGASFTDSGLQAVAHFPLLFCAESRRAVVVPSNLGLGMMKMFEFWRGEPGVHMQTFHDLDEARSWARCNEE